MIRTLFVASLLASVAAPLAAQTIPGNSAPQPTPIVDTIPAAQDTPYPGTIKLDVDATDLDRAIFRVRETIPVAKAGPMTLLYPKWLPGNHAPRGEIEKLAGLVIRANGRVLPWTRDVIDVYAFHIDVPAGARQLDVEFQFISATEANQGRIVVTPTMISLQPNSVSLYPAGYFTRQIPIQMTARFPAGWTAAGAVPAKAAGSTYTYDTTNYEVLVDSPVLAGKYGKVWALSPRVDLNVFADDPKELAATPAQIDAHKRLVDQAVKTFGAQHYDRYEFLLSITDQLGGIGLEHHRSSENGVTPGYFTDWDSGPGRRNLLPHEFTHSWDGKFRRGADLWTPDFRTPMRNSLLWVYEGQTQFWGYVLQARSGLVSKQDTLDMYASILGTYDLAPGRQWRPLIDTTNDPVISARRPKGWTSWQRSEDYYNEGLMVWMEVDAMLRQKSNGTKSIDDFARAFFGIRDGDWGEVTYTFEDVARTLNGIVPYDWAGFLNQRLTETGQPAPVNGFAMNGYKLVYTPEPTPFFKQQEKSRGADVSYSLGLVVANDGRISTVIWNSPAFKAGLDVGTEIQAINGQSYSAERLKAAIVTAKDSKTPIRLLVRNEDRFRDISIDYQGGPRYPRLQKVGTGEGGLDRLLMPR
ncbi:M61 family metallopeptidase [Sphingomonas carotinifaciens]|uniref:Peptidase M61 n=1 Tax=Sphingomonas carotinifaciens TaxID=1166323 RepID=A0A1G7L9S0_9SPHN|nr:M61 family metallopeptidase [Sphingomonas carotinifaciens]MBB4085577.1 putative metalloprotease with PDZ domain [Sphingomonas carotinifaciens]MWC43402.1 peptidase M61 [Sphingomonas carotinifaciens]SDF46121.1 Predicted metalloprotease, contains C-terminal PDZ domain [Sphingomonas carotinifaciens]